MYYTSHYFLFLIHTHRNSTLLYNTQIANLEHSDEQIAHRAESLPHPRLRNRAESDFPPQ